MGHYKLIVKWLNAYLQVSYFHFSVFILKAA